MTQLLNQSPQSDFLHWKNIANLKSRRYGYVAIQYTSFKPTELCKSFCEWVQVCMQVASKFASLSCLPISGIRTIFTYVAQSEILNTEVFRQFLADLCSKAQPKTTELIWREAARANYLQRLEQDSGAQLDANENIEPELKECQDVLRYDDHQTQVINWNPLKAHKQTHCTTPVIPLTIQSFHLKTAR